MKINFKCPKCGCKKLDEVMTGVTQLSTVTHIDRVNGFPVCQYKPARFEDGDLYEYRCSECSEHVAMNERDLLKWLLRHKQVIK